jgi:hypothetical protein
MVPFCVAVDYIRDMDLLDENAIIDLLKEKLGVDGEVARKLVASEDIVVKRQVAAIVESHRTLPHWEREMERSRERLRQAAV